jgi:acyl-CoA thioesterase-1
MHPTSTSSTRWGLSIFATLALTITSLSAAFAVHVNFDYETHNRTDLVGPAGGAGETWNQTMSGGHNVAGGFWGDNVVDSAGTSTAIDWSLKRSDDGGLFRWTGSEEATLSMLDHGIFTNSGLVNLLTLTGLDPAKAYDLYITGHGGSYGNQTTNSTANTTTSPNFQNMLQSGETANWVVNDNYVVFKDMVPDGSGNLVVSSTKVSGYGFWSGFQLVEATPPVFSITSISPVGGDIWELTLAAYPDTLYEFRSSPDLDFSPGTLIENLTQGNPGTDLGTITGLNDEWVNTDSNGKAIVRVTLTGPRNFVRAQDSTLPGSLDLLTAVRAGLPRKVVIAGTSLSHANYGNWPGLMEPWLKGEAPDPTKVTVVNLAISGSNSQTGGINQLAGIKAQNPDTVFMEFSMNDAYTPYNISPQQAEDNHNFIIDDLRAFNPNIEIIIQTMNNPNPSGEPRPNIAAYYQGARDVATAQGLLLIDHNVNWLDLFNTDLTLWNSYVGDGVHPSSAGYADIMIPELQQALEP